MVKYRITVILLGAVGYFLTMARSLSFWDCGEYIAAANVLGIPHAPGNPLFVMLGRVFVLLFGWLGNPAIAVNLISSVSSIICCLLIFEITVKILPKEPNRALLGFFAASISLFGNTFWFNAVEAGAYGISMMVIMLQIWLALKWNEDNSSNKYLILILYIAVLGLGIHTFCLLPLPAIFIFVLIKKRKFSFKFFSAALFVIVLGLSVQLYLPIRASVEPILNENNPVTKEKFLEVIGRAQYGSMTMFERALYRRGALANQFGFSENIGYLGYHLNQWVPAPLGAQVPGTFGEAQFFHRIIFEFLIIAVFVGVWLLRKNLSVVLIAAMFCLSSIGLVLYLNLADGTRPDSYNMKLWNAQTKGLDLPSLKQLNKEFLFYHSLPSEMRDNWMKNAPSAKALRAFFAVNEDLKKQGKKMILPPKNVHREVRNRDYFFTPAFLFFAIMMAIALSAILQKYNSEKARIFYAPILLLAWIIPFSVNFSTNNRSKDFIARDFAKNILNSIPKDGILITYGDNDTFPLWYMQMAENYRTDVIVINEILSYSGWYREQILKRYPNLMADSYGYFIYGIIENNWPEKSVNFMLGANPEDYEEFSENMPIIGLVRNLGMEQSKADSLLVENLTKNYQYSDLNPRGQEANAQTIGIYRYLERVAKLPPKNFPDLPNYRRRLR